MTAATGSGAVELQHVSLMLTGHGPATSVGSAHGDLAREGSPGCVRVLDDVSLIAREGRCLVVMGASGAGKSTLAHVLAGLRAPSSGSVVRRDLASQPADSAIGPLSLVLQRPEDALSNDTVFDKIAASLRLTGMASTDIAARVLEALAWVGLDGSMQRRDPLALSGGEQRRVAIAAVLALRPRLLVLDEPAAGLDAESRDVLRASLGRLLHGGVGLVLVTHDPAEAALLADDLVVLAAGRVAYQGDPRAVLGDVTLADALGVGVAPHVRVAHELAQLTGQEPPRGMLGLDEVAQAIVALVANALGEATADGAGAQPNGASRVAAVAAGDTHTHPHPGAPGETHTHSLPGAAGALRISPSITIARPGRVDVRARVIVWVALIIAAFSAASLAGVGVRVIAAVAAARAAGATWRAVTTALRPLLVIAVGLGLIQWATGAHPSVTIWHTHAVASGAAFAARRIAQVGVLLVGSLALGADASALELAAGLRFLLRPVRVLLRPRNYEDLTMALGIGIGATTTIERDLATLELAQRARGIDLQRVPLLSRLRFRALLAVPLFVLALRRSRQLAESLYMRGYRRGMVRNHLPRPSLATRDLALVMAALALVVVVRIV